jgi:hypothetical protein
LAHPPEITTKITKGTKLDLSKPVFVAFVTFMADRCGPKTPRVPHPVAAREERPNVGITRQRSTAAGETLDPFIID